MSPSTNPPIGAIAYGKSGTPALVIAYREGGLIAIQTPEGQRLKVHPEAIVRWEVSKRPGFNPGDRVTIDVSNGLDAEKLKRFKRHGRSGVVRSFDASTKEFCVQLDGDNYIGYWREEFLVEEAHS